jgi:REP element-mobilizing transposase RayT
MRSNNKVSFVCKYHVVWCPKYRRQVLVKGAGIRLEAIIREVCRERSAELIEVEVMPDHVHLLVEVDPQFGIHRLVKAIKGRSSRLLLPAENVPMLLIPGTSSIFRDGGRRKTVDMCRRVISPLPETRKLPARLLPWWNSAWFHLIQGFSAAHQISVLSSP